MQEGDKTLSLLESLCNVSLELGESLKFDKNHQLHFHVVALYGSAIELVDTLIQIAKNDNKVGIPIIFRSILECTIDLKNLCKDKTYGYRLELDFIRSWKNLLGEARKGDNIYLKQVGEHPAVSQTIKEYKNREVYLAQEGYKRIEIKEKFQLAELEAEYFTIYSSACAHTHNSIQALRERHAEIGENGFRIVYFKEKNLNDIDHYMGMACELLVQSTEVIHKLLGEGSEEKVSELRQRLDQHKRDVENI